MVYAGIGFRNTPYEIIMHMESVAMKLADVGYTLRSGGANGADEAFERGCRKANGKKEIFLPIRNYNGNPSDLYQPTDKAMEIAERFHPAWHKCTKIARIFLARNSHIVLGENLDQPVDFIVCWTEETGGTYQSLRIAKNYDIVVYNLRYDFDDFSKFLSDIRKGQ